MDNFPDEVIKQIFFSGGFRDILALVLVCKKFRRLAPKWFYSYLETAIIDLVHGKMVNIADALDLSLVPWAAIGLDEDDQYTSDQRIMNTAALMICTGFTDSASSKIRSRLFPRITTNMEKGLFRACLNGTMMQTFRGVPWNFCFISDSFVDLNAHLYPAYHIPLMELGCHPRIDDVLGILLSVITHFEGDFPNQPELKGDNGPHPLYMAAKSTLRLPFINRSRLFEHCLSIADMVYFFHGPQHMMKLEGVFNNLLGDEYQFDYNEQVFRVRIQNPTNIYQLLISFERVGIIPDNLINLLQDPIVWETFCPFFNILHNIHCKRPIDIKSYTPIMMNSLRCFLRLPIHSRYKPFFAHAVWQTEDNATIALLISCSVSCFTVDFFERAATRKGIIALPCSFGTAHWSLIYTMVPTAEPILNYIVDWIYIDLCKILATRDEQYLVSYRNMFRSSAPFFGIVHYACHLLNSTSHFSEDEIWALRNLFSNA